MSRPLRPLLFTLLALAPALPSAADTRSMDGGSNNLLNPSWGAANTELRRLVPALYEDGQGAIADGSRPSARGVSNAISAQPETIPSARGLSGMIWQWGQFLDHDIGKTPGVKSGGQAPIPVPSGDLFFDPFSTGVAVINFTRSQFNSSSSTRQQINTLTAWIDASNVYGSGDDQGAALRTGENGMLKTSAAGDYLPYTTDVFEGKAFDPSDLYTAGDDRANEQLGLTAMHTLFVREHNRLAALFAAANLSLTDEEIYQRARRIVGAEMQTITYNEFLPALLGEGAVPPYTGYDASVDGTLANEFSAAAYRLGHSMLNSQIAIVNCTADGSPVAAQGMLLRDIFFQPDKLTAMDIGQILGGLATQKMEEIDAMVIDDVRNFLFGEPGDEGLDLVSLNVQRGRDHGLGSFQDLRAYLGLDLLESFAQLTGSDGAALAQALEDLYGSLDNADMWIALLSEAKVEGSSVGETLQAFLLHQFEALRVGDRFFYLNDALLASELAEIGLTIEDLENYKLGEIIRTNTGVQCVQDNVFFATCTSLTNTCTGVRPRGDLNSDGVVSVIDVVQVINEIVFSINPTPINDYVFGDLDEDGVIGVLDVLLIIAVINEA